MHNKSKHGQRRYVFHTDVTVNDYANSTPNANSGARVKKGGVGKSLIHKQGLKDMQNQDADGRAVTDMLQGNKQLEMSCCGGSDMKEGISEPQCAKLTQDINEVDWFDRDFDDFESKLEYSCQQEEFTEDCTIAKPKKRKAKKRQRNKSDEGGDIVYPIDLWFQLSRFVHPETIGKFALICKGSHRVVNTIQFWKGLFLRFYFTEETKKATLPDHLTFENIERVHGLRSRVIQMLYVVYPQLADRSKTTVPFEDEPQSLVGQRCVLMWQYKHRNVWKFCFKFHKGSETEMQFKSNKCWTSPDFVDLFYNPDNNCTIVEVTCSNFISLPSVMGLVLNQVYISVSSGMRYHRLKMVLDTSFKTSTNKTQTGMTDVVLDPALDMRVYPWWEPNYHRLLYSMADGCQDM